MMYLYDVTGKLKENKGMIMEQKGGRDVMTDMRWRNN
jgi:hypothetical protein